MFSPGKLPDSRSSQPLVDAGIFFLLSGSTIILPVPGMIPTHTVFRLYLDGFLQIREHTCAEQFSQVHNSACFHTHWDDVFHHRDFCISIPSG